MLLIRVRLSTRRPVEKLIRYAVMHPVFRHILSCLIALLIGSVSAAFVVLVARLLNRKGGTRLEVVFSVSAVVGFVLLALGNLLESRAMLASSVLLCGWVVLPIVLIPLVLAYRLIVWLLRKVAE